MFGRFGRFSSRTKEQLGPLMQIGWGAAKFFAIMHLTFDYVFDITLCVGPSMMPLFRPDGDVVLVDKITPKLKRRYQRGDVVVAIPPNAPDKVVCKRIVGMPGDIVRIHPRFSMYPREEMVPPGCVWLEGDNKLNSTDSRTYGPVPISLLQGRVFMQIWHKFRMINHTSWERDPQEIQEDDKFWEHRSKLLQTLRDPKDREDAEDRKLQREKLQAAIEEILENSAVEATDVENDEDHDEEDAAVEEIVEQIREQIQVAVSISEQDEA